MSSPMATHFLRKTRTSRAPSRSLLEIEPGLVIAICPSVEILEYARLVLTSQMVNAAYDTGLQFPKVGAIHSIYAGPQEERFSSNEAARKQLMIGDNLMNHEEVVLINSFVNQNFDFFGTIGQKFLMSQIASDEHQFLPSWIVFSQEVNNENLPTLLVDTLTMLRAAAKQARSYIMIMLVRDDMFDLGLNDADNNHLSELCDELIFIEECEPYSNQQVAFSIDFISARKLNKFGIGKVMCSINHLGHFDYHQFFAQSANFRAASEMYWRGNFDYEEISAITGISRDIVQEVVWDCATPQYDRFDMGQIDTHFQEKAQSRFEETRKLSSGKTRKK